MARCDMSEIESTMPAEITLVRPVSWRYDAQKMNGKCMIYGDTLPLSVSLLSQSTTKVPDVVLVDRWLRERLESAPTTVEDLAVETAQRWGFDCEVVGGPTENHGIITARAGAR